MLPTCFCKARHLEVIHTSPSLHIHMKYQNWQIHQVFWALFFVTSHVCSPLNHTHTHTLTNSSATIKKEEKNYNYHLCNQRGTKIQGGRSHLGIKRGAKRLINQTHECIKEEKEVIWAFKEKLNSYSDIKLRYSSSTSPRALSMHWKIKN